MKVENTFHRHVEVAEQLGKDPWHQWRHLTSAFRSEQHKRVTRGLAQLGAVMRVDEWKAWRMESRCSAVRERGRGAVGAQGGTSTPMGPWPWPIGLQG